MALTDTRIRSAKPKPKPYKLSDGGGTYLLVMPDGARYWRMDYRFAGKRRTLALGVYPALSLSNARALREDARVSLAQASIPPLQRKRGSALQKWSPKTRSKPLRESGSPTSGTGWRPVTAHCFSRGLRRTCSLTSDLALLPMLMRPNCSTLSERSRSVGLSRLPCGFGSSAAKYSAMPSRPDAQSMIRLPTLEAR